MQIGERLNNRIENKCFQPIWGETWDKLFANIDFGIGSQVSISVCTIANNSFSILKGYGYGIR
jgi:hypothetical protein